MPNFYRVTLSQLPLGMGNSVTFYELVEIGKSQVHCKLRKIQVVAFCGLKSISVYGTPGNWIKTIISWSKAVQNPVLVRFK